MSRDYARSPYVRYRTGGEPELEVSDAPAIELSRSIVCGGSLNATHVPTRTAVIRCRRDRTIDRSIGRPSIVTGLSWIFLEIIVTFFAA